MMSCAAYSSELMLMRAGLSLVVMYLRVRVLTSVGHSKYHQNLASAQYPPAADRLESLRATPKGTRGMRYAMGHDVGQRDEDSARSINRRSLRRSAPMWWRSGQPCTERAVAPVWNVRLATPEGEAVAVRMVRSASRNR